MSENAKPQIRHYAFISYNHQDAKTAQWLQHKLEHYKLPSTIHNELESTRYLRPIFRDKTDLSTGQLDEELRLNLEQSKYLIVICSRHSAQSRWVSQEVQRFIDWGRLPRIIPFVIEGEGSECFPQSLRDHIAAHPDDELLGVNVEEVGREKAFIRVVSKMLGVAFDELWRRHERERRRKIAIASVTTPLVAALLYWFAVPVSLTVDLNDDTHHLPMPNDATLVIGGRHYDLHNLDTTICLNSLPGYFRHRSIELVFSATYYQPQTDTVTLGLGTQNLHQLQLQRDNTFAVYAGKVVDDERRPVANACVCVAGHSATTDADGLFRIELPVSEQGESMEMTIEHEGYAKLTEETWAGEDMTCILH